MVSLGSIGTRQCDIDKLIRKLTSKGTSLIAQWLTTATTERPSRATGEIPARRLEVERARLRPLAIGPADDALKIAVVVSARGRVSSGGRQDSMPPAAIGPPAPRHLDRDRIEIVTKTGAVSRPPRDLGAGQASILPEHRAAMVEAVRGVRGRLDSQRQRLWELGPAAERWLTELIHRRPGHWRPDVEPGFASLQDDGPAALLDAFAWGVRHHAIGAEDVATHLARRPAMVQATR